MDEERLDKIRLELRRGVLVLAVLALLKQPRYGYSLRKQLTDSGIDMDEGTLYPLVRRLAEQGLLDSEWQQAQGRDRRYYTLSEDGRELLAQLTGESPGRYQKRRRLEWACAAIYHGEQSLKQIADELGFCDVFHFSKAFKQETGLTPSEYRRRVKGA